MLPARISREPKPGVPKRVRSPGHLSWVRKHECIVAGCHGRPIVAAHVRKGTDGATSIKPGDHWTVSMCHYHHNDVQHVIGEPEFERRFDIDLKAKALEFARKSPHRATLIRQGAVF